MGAAIKLMRSFTLNIVLSNAVILTLLSCNAKKEPQYQSKEAFLQAYKTSVFFGCIDEATNGNFSEFSRENNDLGLAPQVAVIYHAETQQARELGTELSKRIKPSSYMDYEGRAPIYSDCVSYAFFSAEVDSIARAEYKELKNGEMKYIYEE